VILKIPNWDSIRKEDVSNILAIQRPDNHCPSVHFLLNPAEFGGAMNVFDKFDACLRQKKKKKKIPAAS
jgi:hypothetical protein